MEVSVVKSPANSLETQLSQALRKHNVASFQEFQNIKLILSDGESSPLQTKLQLLQQSKVFRKHLFELENSFGEIFQQMDGYGRTAELNHESKYELVQSLSSHWHLLEIVAMNPAVFIVHDIVDWLQGSFSSNILKNESISFFGTETHPERITTDESIKRSFPSGYWDTVYQLALEGQLNSVVELLKLHSEVKTILAYPDRKHAPKFFSPLKQSLQANDPIQHEQLHGLLETLLRHPYLPSQRGPLGGNSAVDDMLYRLNNEYPYIQSLEQRVEAWKASLTEFLRHPQSIIYAIPELELLFRICLCDTNAIVNLTQGNWVALTLAQLFYHYTPKLTRAHLAQLIEDNMTYTASSGSGMRLEEEGSSAVQIQTQQALIRHCLKQQLGPFLQLFYAHTYSVSSAAYERKVQHEFKMTMLLSLVHLLRLLVVTSAVEGLQGNTSAHPELITQLPRSHHETNVLEELILESLTLFLNFGYPVEMLVEYLSLCPVQGKAYLRVLLTRHEAASDDEAKYFAVLLDNIHCPTEASQVLAARGQYWFCQYAYKSGLKDTVRANRREFGWCPNTPVAPALSKAVHFFQLAGDYARLSGMLECVFRRLQSAVVDCLDCFPGLSILPGIIVPDVLGEEKVAADKLTNILSLLQAPSKEAKEEVWGVKEQLEVLSHAVMEADQVIEGIELAALLEDLQLLSEGKSSLKYPAFLSTLLPQQYDALDCYLQAIKLRLQVLSSPESPKEAGGVKTVYSPLTISRKLREAADHVVKLLLPSLDAKELPIVPQRYWLHLLELCLCFHQIIGDYESKLTLDCTFLAQYIDSTELSEPVPEKFSLGVFSKDQVYALHDLFLALETNVHAEWIFGITQAKPQMLKSLKTKLLGMLMSSIATEKIVFGRTNRSKEGESTESKMKKWHIDSETRKKQAEFERQRRIAVFGFDPFDNSLSSGGLVFPNLPSAI